MNTITKLISDAKEFAIPLPEITALVSEAAAQVTACYAAGDWLESQGRRVEATNARRWAAIHNQRFMKLWTTAETMVLGS